MTPKNAHTNFYSVPWKTTDLLSQTIFASIHVPGTFNVEAESDEQETAPALLRLGPIGVNTQILII